MAALIAGLLAGCADAAPPATPATIDRVLARARGGETIILAAGEYGRLVMPPRDYAPGIRIDARAARFSGIVLRRVGGVAVDGGTIAGPGGRSYGIDIRDARDVRVAGMRIAGAHRGIVVAQSERVAIVRNILTGLVSDGIDIALSRHVLVDRNSCRDFAPTAAVYDSAGALVRDGDHPDCIQAWSRPTASPTSDLTITGNDIEGAMQGIFLGNHVRGGIDDGGFDRVVVRDNRVRVSRPNAIALIGVRGGEVSGNSVGTVAGAMMPNRPGRPVKASLRVQDGSGVRVCGNRIEPPSRGPEGADSAC